MFVVSFKTVTLLNLTEEHGDLVALLFATRMDRFGWFREPLPPTWYSTRVAPTSFAMILAEKAPDHRHRQQEDKQPGRANAFLQ
jgi:hypothetical protein